MKTKHQDVTDSVLGRYIFPGLGLGATLCKAKMMSDEMILVAAETLAECLTEEEASKGQVTNT